LIRGLVGLALIDALVPLRQPTPVGYEPGCYAFLETVRTSIKSRSGTAAIDDKAGRDGLIVVRLGRDTGGLGVQAWYDTLAVWRLTGSGREEPNVEGFLGGRYRGTLTRDGRYAGLAWPFVPPDLAQLADLAPVMDDFLPRLPLIDLPVGREWSDTTGLTIKRQPDTRDRTGSVRHYTWTSTRRIADRIDATDSVAIALEQLVKEEGDLRWSPKAGPSSWTRHLAISAHVPAREGVKQSVQTAIEQDITVTRRPDDPICAAAKGGGEGS
jgi:hypothetical protein